MVDGVLKGLQILTLGGSTPGESLDGDITLGFQEVCATGIFGDIQISENNLEEGTGKQPELIGSNLVEKKRGTNSVIEI